MKAFLDRLMDFLKLSTDKILLVLAAVFILLSFNPVSFQNKAFRFTLSPTPNWILLTVGTVFLLTFLWDRRKRPDLRHSIRTVANGYLVRLDGDFKINVIFGRIEDEKVTAPEDHSAVVLPSNTTFDDECIRDSRSSLGSFVMKHFPNAVASLQADIRSLAIRECEATPDTFREAVPGTTVVLPKPLGSNYTLLITAVTKRDKNQIISADTLSVLSAVKQVLRRASQEGLSTLTMPVIGTGHGGLDFRAALSLILVQTMHCMKFEGCHRVRSVTIVVFDPAKEKKDIVESIVTTLGTSILC